MTVNLNPGGIAGGSGGQYFVGDFDGTTFTSDDPPTYTPPSGTVLQDFESATFAPWTTTGTAFGTGPTAGNAARPGRRQRLPRRQAGQQLQRRRRRHRDADLTRVHDQPGLPELPGRRRQPPARPRHRARRHPAAGPVFADFEGNDLGHRLDRHRRLRRRRPRPGDHRRPATGQRLPRAASWSTPSWTTTRPPARSRRPPSRSPATTSTCSSAAGTIRAARTRRRHGRQPPRRRPGRRHRDRAGQRAPRTGWRGTPPSGSGQQAQIQIVDNNTGGWGHINVDNIVFSPQAAVPRDDRDRRQPPGRRQGGPLHDRRRQRGTSTGRTGTSATCAARRPPSRSSTTTPAAGGTSWPTSSRSPTAPALSATERAHWLDYGRDFYAGGDLQQRPRRPADHDRLDEQLAVRAATSPPIPGAAR